jgi:hypothetical protein
MVPGTQLSRYQFTRYDDVEGLLEGARRVCFAIPMLRRPVQGFDILPGLEGRGFLPAGISSNLKACSRFAIMRSIMVGLRGICKASDGEDTVFQLLPRIWSA